ncbi:uncharacterized protein [Musca autumnalis]|uniref:uncharacterized protein n=1 Tax=Musca autumnalis TaxID=221902 RepID=UPI003CF39974
MSHDPNQSPTVIPAAEGQINISNDAVIETNLTPTTKRKRRHRITTESNMEKEYLEKMSVRGLDTQNIKSMIDGIIHCLLCSQNGVTKTFKNQYSFQRHVFLLHSGIRKIFRCPICNSEFSRPDKMNEHKKTKHRETQQIDSKTMEKENSKPNETKTEQKNKRKSNNKTFIEIKENIKLEVKTEPEETVMTNSTLTLADGTQVQLSVPNVLPSTIKQETISDSFMADNKPQLQYTTLGNVSYVPTTNFLQASQNFQIINAPRPAADNKETFNNKLSSYTVNQMENFTPTQYQSTGNQIQMIKIEDVPLISLNQLEYIKIPTHPPLQPLKIEDIVASMPNAHTITLPNGLQAIQIGSIQINSNLDSFTILPNNQLLQIKQE